MSIDRFRELAMLLVDLDNGGGDVGRWFANRLATYEAGARDGLSFDQAAGLVPKAGQDKWWQVEDRAERDRLLQVVARRWYATEPSRRQQAIKIATELRNYEASAWIRDRVYADPPETSRGTVRDAQFRLLRLGKAPKPRTIEGILAGADVVPKG